MSKDKPSDAKKESPIWSDHEPYVKPTRYVHDSGFRTFEVGYCKIGKDNRVESKKVLGKYTDHILTEFLTLGGQIKPFSVNMDLTKDGYIRFFSRFGRLGWGGMDELAFSSMGLVVKEWKEPA